MTVSLCIIAYNEEESLPSLLDDVLSQSYDKTLTEIVLVDSLSDDGTPVIFRDFCEKHRDEYMSVQVLENKKRSQAAGWNTAIKAATGDVIIRVDAHASIPRDFIEKNMQLISEGEFVCGGARPSNILEPSPKREMLLLAESSMFGSSIASYRRRSEGKKYVSSLFHGAYRREVFEKVGGFDESLGRTEDNELHWRIRQNGFKICQSGDIISYQNIRPTLSKMLAQKYANGKWIGLTSGVCPDCLSVFHFAPFCLVAMILLCIIAAAVGAITKIKLLWLPLLLLVGAYVLGDLVISVAAFFQAEKKSPWLLLLPLVFPLLHFGYGIGTFIGLLTLPQWKKSLDGSAQREIEVVRECVRKNSEMLRTRSNNIKEEIK